MKNYNQISLFSILCISLSMIALIGCEEQVLNKEPTTSISENDVYQDIDVAKKIVWQSYNDMDWRLKGRTNRPIFTDVFANYLTSVVSANTDQYNTGIISPDNQGFFGNVWNIKYENIARVNDFLAKVDGLQSADAAEKTRILAEMKFIRAYNYADLIKLYGGVPLITEPFGLEDDFQVERNSYKACVDFIIGELDNILDNNEIPANLPDNEWGRVNIGAVRSLKSEVLLYAASKLHDPSTQPSGELYDYNDANKWQDASDAAKAVLDMPEYSLVEPVNTWEDYQEILLHPNDEMIFARPAGARFQLSNRLDQILSPNGFTGANTTWAPTQNAVDEYQMSDGKSIQDSPLYDSSANNIYKNKELRFYANIVYNGSTYRNTAIEFYLPGGIHSTDANNSRESSKTRYSIRKFMEEDYDYTSAVNPQKPKAFYRLAEIKLNYAEAQYHLGNEGVARDQVNDIRSRVNLPDISSSGPALLDDIRHERNIELMFEGHHFFDGLRWMTAENEFGEDAIGIIWEYLDGSGNLQSPSDGGTLNYRFETIQQREFNMKQYYIPIPNEEIIRTNLQQNEGY